MSYSQCFFLEALYDIPLVKVALVAAVFPAKEARSSLLELGKTKWSARCERVGARTTASGDLRQTGGRGCPVRGQAVGRDARALVDPRGGPVRG